MRRMRMGALAASVALFALGCDSMPGKPDEAERYVQPDKITDFDYLYQKTCSGCHGYDGSGGSGPSLMYAISGNSDAELETIILEGSGGMPAQDLSAQEVADVIAHLREIYGEHNGDGHR